MLDRFERFSFSIFEISRCWHKIAAEEMGKYDLKGPHAIYLLALHQNPEGLTSAQLCEMCGRDKADVSRAMMLLEEKNLVCREGENTYRARLVLTSSGVQAAKQVEGRACVAVELAGKDISDEDRKTFYAALSSITDNLRKLSQDGLPK